MQNASAILSTFIKLPFVIKIFVLSIFEWPLKTGLTVYDSFLSAHNMFDLRNKKIVECALLVRDLCNDLK